MNMKPIFKVDSNFIKLYNELTWISGQPNPDAIKQMDECLKPLDDALAAVQKRTTVRNIKPIDIVRYLKRLTDKMNISKKAMEGIELVNIDLNAQQFPRAYKYKPESTKFNAVYKRGAWEVTSITREECTPNRGRVVLTDEAKVAIVKRYEEA